MSNASKQRLVDLKSFVTYRLSQVQNKLNAQAAYLLKERSDLSLVEWRILQLLSLFEDTSMTELARDVQMDKGQLSRKMKTMIDKGLITTEPDSTDQRRQKLKLSDQGIALHASILPMMKRRQDLLVSDVSDADLATFSAVLDKLGAAASKREPV